MSSKQSSLRVTPRLVLGLGVVMVGLLLTADTLGLYDAETLLDYWPLILVAIGTTKLGGRSTADIVFACCWIGIGLWLLAWNLGYLDFSPVEVFWPIVLILFGLTLIFGAMRRSRPSPTSDSRVNVVAVMGGVERTNSSQDFLGGDVTVFMGGGHLDLRQASIQEDEAVIQVFTLWGGYEFRVPPDWNVSLEVLPLLAGVEDKRTQRIANEAGDEKIITRLGDNPESDSRRRAPTLVIKGFVIMGGIEVIN